MNKRAGRLRDRLFFSQKLLSVGRLAASESVRGIVTLAIRLSVHTVAISTVLILILVLPGIATLALVKTTALIAVLPAEIPALFEAPVSIGVKAAIELAPVVVPETPFKSWRNCKPAEKRHPAPISGNPRLAIVALRPISVNPGVVRTGTRRDIVSVSRRSLIETAASAKAYANRESALCKHRTSSQEHHRQQFRFHFRVLPSCPC